MSAEKNMFKYLITFLLAASFWSASLSAGQSPKQPLDLQWSDARELTIEGKGWNDTKDFYDRLPARAESVVRKAVWTLSRDSAGCEPEVRLFRSPSRTCAVTG